MAQILVLRLRRRLRTEPLRPCKRISSKHPLHLWHHIVSWSDTAPAGRPNVAVGPIWNSGPSACPWATFRPRSWRTGNAVTAFRNSCSHAAVGVTAVIGPYRIKRRWPSLGRWCLTGGQPYLILSKWRRTHYCCLLVILIFYVNYYVERMIKIKLNGYLFPLSSIFKSNNYGHLITYISLLSRPYCYLPRVILVTINGRCLAGTPVLYIS